MIYVSKIHACWWHSTQSLDDMGLHVLSLKRVTVDLPQPFNSYVSNAGRTETNWKWIVRDYMLQPQIWSNCIIVCDWVALAACYCCWSLLYSATLHSWADSLHSHVFLHEWLAFHSVFLNIHQSDVLTTLFDCYMAGATWNCYHLGVFCVHHTTMHHIMSLHAKPHT